MPATVKLDTFEIKDTFTVTGLAAAEPLQKFTRRLFAFALAETKIKKSGCSSGCKTS